MPSGNVPVGLFVISPRTTRNSLVLFVSNGLKLATGFLATLLLARELQAGPFGQYSLITNVALTISALSDFGLGFTFVRLYAVRKGEGVEALRRFREHMLLLRVAASAVLFVGALLCLPLIMPMFVGGGVDLGVTRIACCIILGDGVASFILALFQAEEEFGKYALFNAAGNPFRLVALIALALTGTLTVASATLVFGLSFLLTAVAGIAMSGVRLVSARLREIRPSLRGVFYWSRWLVIQSVANTLFVKLDLLVLGYFAVAHDLVGNYALALRFCYVVVVFQMTANTMLLPKVSRLVTADDIRVYRRKAHLVMAVGVPVLAATCWVGYAVIVWMYGSTYPEAARLFLLLFLAMGVGILTAPIALTSFTMERPQIPAFQNLAGAILAFLLLLWLVPRLGVYGAAYAMLISHIVSEGGAYLFTAGLLRARIAAGN